MFEVWGFFVCSDVVVLWFFCFDYFVVDFFGCYFFVGVCGYLELGVFVVDWCCVGGCDF